MEIPEEFYKKWLLTANRELSKEDLEKDLEHYIRDLKWTLLKNKIAEDNDVKVENADVVSKAKDFIKEQYGIFEVNDEIDKNLDVIANNYLQQNEGESYMKIYNQVHTEKIMDLLKQKATINVKNVSREEFNKKVEN
jgi:trigger factor